MLDRRKILRDIVFQQRLGDDLLIVGGHPCQAFILEYLENCDHDFYEPLSSRVTLDDFSQKLSALSTTFILLFKSAIAGVVCAYLYAPEGKKGFITLVHVKQEFRGQHLANKLLASAYRHAKERGFETIELFVSKQQVNAFQLYLRNGFTVVTEEANGRCLMRCLL